MLKKVISGGQTGVDYIGIHVADEVGLETGGTAPKGFRTEYGHDWSRLKNLGLVEHTSYRYEPRTEQNVIDSDGTVLFGNLDSTGSQTTIKFIKKHTKPSISNPTPEELINFINENNITTLNVAGNRASKLTHRQMIDIINVLRKVFKFFKDGID